MNKLLKICLFTCVMLHEGFSATELKSNEAKDDLIREAKAVAVDFISEAPLAQLPFRRVSIDFSTDFAKAASALAITFSFADDSPVLAGGVNNLAFFVYVAMECLAAESRVSTSDLKNLKPYFESQTAVYNTFRKIYGTLTCAKEELDTIFHSRSTTRTFVSNVVDNDFDKLFVALDLNDNDIQIFNSLKPLINTTLVPAVSTLLYKGYKAANQLKQIKPKCLPFLCS